MSLNEAKDLIASASKKESHQGWFGSNKLDEAADLYARAGNIYKIHKSCKFLLAYSTFRNFFSI